jgi:glycosyltransferase involved in cell wall biosynthesis
MRYVWDLYDDYFGPRASLAVRALMPPVAAALRAWDRRTDGVDGFMAISQHIAERIRRVYGRSADVIYPPVDTARFRPVARPDDFYLVVGALVPYKRIDLAVATANRLRRRLLVVGVGPEARRLRDAAGPTIEFLGWRPDAEVADLYARCRALLFPAVEDYGIVPLEAAAAGRPTIALARGGALETMIGLGRGDDAPPTALFFEEQTEAALTQAILDFEAAEKRFDPVALRARAAEFDTAVFRRRLREYLEGRWAEFQARRAC